MGNLVNAKCDGANVRLTPHGVIADDESIAYLHEEFSRRACVVLPGFLAPSLVQRLVQRLATASFIPKVEADAGGTFGEVMLLPVNDPTLFIWNFLFNKPAFFRIVERVTGCPTIGNFLGRIHRSYPTARHRIDWHDDDADTRLIGLTVNLSTEEYAGGVFQVRERDSQRLLHQASRDSLGDALLFRISRALQHQLTPVEQGGCRTVGVGWFRAEPDWPTFSKAYLGSTR